MKKCFGIVSWLPDDHRRDKRRARVVRLLKRLEELWPDTDIIIIKQNWKTTKVPKISNKIIEYNFSEGLGILKARQTLNEKFLELDYDYLITMDDDCLIAATQEDAKLFFEDIDNHADGFCFIAGHNDHLNGNYAGAQFNLACLSRYILEHEPLPQLDPQKGQAYEDCIYSCLLHNKYPEHEFWLTSPIKHTQWQNSKEPVPTTWSTAGNTCGVGDIGKNTAKIYDFIEERKDIPNLELFYTYGILVNRNSTLDNPQVKQLKENAEQRKKLEAKLRGYDGRLSTSYLYF